MNKAIFLDRDGVINREKNYIYKIEDFEFIDGVFESLRYMQQLGFLLFVITNQSGIGRGYYTEQDFLHLTNWMIWEFKKQGVSIEKVYYCPFHPEGVGSYRKVSSYRKPSPGMILQAQQEFQLDLKNSIVIGDQESDIEAGINAGVSTTILVRSGHPIDERRTKAMYILESIKEFREICIYK